MCAHAARFHLRRGRCQPFEQLAPDANAVLQRVRQRVPLVAPAYEVCNDTMRPVAAHLRTALATFRHTAVGDWCVGHIVDEGYSKEVLGAETVTHEPEHTLAHTQSWSAKAVRALWCLKHDAKGRRHGRV